MEAVTDWKGNVIKEGDEVCHIRINTKSIFSKIVWFVPSEFGEEDKSFVVDVPIVDCWEVGPYREVKSGPFGLYTTVVSGNFIFQQLIDDSFSKDSSYILAIKGVSDTKN